MCAEKGCSLTGHVFAALIVGQSLITATAVHIAPVAIVLLRIGGLALIVAREFIRIQDILDGEGQAFVGSRTVASRHREQR